MQVVEMLSPDLTPRSSRRQRQGTMCLHHRHSQEEAARHSHRAISPHSQVAGCADGNGESKGFLPHSDSGVASHGLP